MLHVFSGGRRSARRWITKRRELFGSFRNDVIRVVLWRIVRDNILSTQRLLEASRDRQLQRFILASSSSIYGDAETLPTTEDAKPAPMNF